MSKLNKITGAACRYIFRSFISIFMDCVYKITNQSDETIKYFLTIKSALKEQKMWLNLVWSFAGDF